MRQKKLVYITNNRMPAERAYSSQIMHMCMEFYRLSVQRGWEFELVIPQRYLPAARDVFSYHGFEKKFNVAYLACFDAIHLMPGLGQLAYWIQTITFIFSLLGWSLKQKNHNIVVYTRELYIAVLFSAGVYEMHTIPENLSWVFRFLLRRCKKIVAITQTMKQDLLLMGCDEDRIIVAPDGIDLDRFGNVMSKEDARKELNIPVRQFVVAYTGSFFQHEWKGVDVLLDAAKQLVHDPVHFVLVGGHPEEIETMGEFDNYPNIKIIGYSSFKVVRLYLAAADVVVIPNKTGYRVSDRYTSPLKLFEYMAVQRLIVASRVPSLMEVIDESSAVFFEPNNAADLARILKDLSENFQQHQEKVVHAYERVKSYTWAQRAERIVEIL